MSKHSTSHPDPQRDQCILKLFLFIKLTVNFKGGFTEPVTQGEENSSPWTKEAKNRMAAAAAGAGAGIEPRDYKKVNNRAVPSRLTTSKRMMTCQKHLELHMPFEIDDGWGSVEARTLAAQIADTESHFELLHRQMDLTEIKIREMQKHVDFVMKSRAEMKERFHRAHERALARIGKSRK